MRRYSELILLPSFEERFKYCDLHGNVGDPTFGGSRWLNQVLYSSPEWKQFRREIIIRDHGCDLAIEDCPIRMYGVIHHLNPITKTDILERNPCVFDPENVIFVASDTHKYIHYGYGSTPKKGLVERKPNDTCPWR